MEDNSISAARRNVLAGKFKAAHAAAQQHLRANSGDPAAVIVLAQIALEHGNLAGADRLAKLIRQTGHSEPWLDVIDARLALARQDAAAARGAIRRAAAAGTDDANLAAQIGVVLARTGLHEDAVRFSAQAVEGRPENVDYRYNYAIELQFNGQLDEARAKFESLVRDAPDHAQAWLALLGLVKDPADTWRETLEAQFAATQDTEARLIIGHALAKWHELHANWDQSFAWLERAKQQKAREVAHSRTDAERLFAAAIASAKGTFSVSTSLPQRRPIFVTGLPRSGTTLVERIVAAHPDVRSLGELSEFGIALKRTLGTPGQHVLDAPLLKAADEAESLEAAGQLYLELIDGLSEANGVFVDKMPFNIFYAPAILKALPDARIICLRRSPFDTVLSNFRQLFATGFSYYSYAYDFADTAHFVAGFEAMADAFERQLPSDRFMAIRYENLVANQAEETKRLIDFCGLNWAEECLAPQSNAQPVATASAAQVRSPVHSRSVGAWRRYGEAAERLVTGLAKYGINNED